MGRVEDNNELIAKMPNTFSGKSDEIMAKLEMQNLSILRDISRSMAQIADSCSNKDVEDDVKAADEYVRDHLLIEWMMHTYALSGQVEDIYDAWQRYLANYKGAK